MLFAAIDLCLILCIVSMAWALAPLIETGLPLGTWRQPLLILPGFIADRQKTPLSNLLRRLAALLPQGYLGLSLETRTNPVYPGSRMTLEEFRGLQVLVALFGLLLGGGLSLEFRAIGLPHAVLAAMAGFFVPLFWVRSKIRSRERAILRLLPEVIDLLALCVGAGADFLGGLNRIVAAEQYRGQPLIDELSITIQEMKFGKRKAEALRAMARRLRLAEINSFVRAIVLAERMGTPIADVLQVHSEDVRASRYNRAERAALKAPLKILFPLVFCIMPCVALIVAAPIFIQFARVNPMEQFTASQTQQPQRAPQLPPRQPPNYPRLP
jgi:Flp pilus assembly protein TadB